MSKNGFVKKNVGTLTLGERLSKMRSEKRITLGEASKSARIQVKYLEYLESGRYEKLPADVYIKGFIRSYAQFLGVDENYLIKLYERERDIYNNVKKEEPKKSSFQPLKFSRLVVTPKILFAAAIVFFIGLGFFYLYRELSIFISNPRLIITQPDDNFSIREKVVKVVGITEKDAKLFINDQPVIVDEEGKFSEELVLQPGVNNIRIKAINRFEKESEVDIDGEAVFENIAEENSASENQPPEEEKKEEESNEKKISLAVIGDTKAVSISVNSDGESSFTGIISPGENKLFEAKEKISISAEKGKYVRMIYNGNDLGLLSKDTKPASRTFVAE